MIPALKFHFGSIANSGIRINISANANNINLYTLAGSPTTPGEFTFTVASGVTIGSTSSTVAAIVTGTFPAGSIVKLINNGNIYGRGGLGGAGRGFGVYAAGIPGAAGGDAISCTYNLSVTNNGEIRAGGGGGGGGPNSNYGSGAGGNGQGSQGAATNGTAGFSRACSYTPPFGESGAICYEAINEGNGGNGGAWATPGSNSTSSTYNAACCGSGSGTYFGPSSGGAAGLAMRKNGTTSSITGGTISGAQT